MSLFAKSANPIPPPPLGKTNVEKSEKEKQFAASFVEDLCLCQVCYMRFNETTKLARSLSCGHTFCTECIETVKKYGNSAYVECPTCRTESKCAVGELAPNYMVMETVRKFGFLGPPVKVVVEKKTAAPVRRAPTSEEVIDEAYRQLISSVKSELLQKFERFKIATRGTRMFAIRRELAQMSEEIDRAIQDAYNEYSESEGDADSSIETARYAPNVSGSLIVRGLRAVYEPLRGVFRFFRKIYRVENPVNPNRSDIEFESDSDEESSSSTDSSDSSDSSSTSSSSYSSSSSG